MVVRTLRVMTTAPAVRRLFDVTQETREVFDHRHGKRDRVAAHHVVEALGRSPG